METHHLLNPNLVSNHLLNFQRKKIDYGKNFGEKEILPRLTAFFGTSILQAIDFLYNTAMMIGTFFLAIARAAGAKQLNSRTCSFKAVLERLGMMGLNLSGMITGSIGGAIYPKYLEHLVGKSDCGMLIQQDDFTFEPLPLNQYFDKVMYLSLASRPEKQDALENYLGKLEVDAEWFPAFLGKDAEKSLAVLKQYGYEPDPKLSPEKAYEKFLSRVRGRNGGLGEKMGIVGCFLSHLLMLQKARAENKKNVLILEDDCRFVQGSQEKLEEAMKQLPEDWDMFFLGGLQFWENADLKKGKYNSKHAEIKASQPTPIEEGSSVAVAGGLLTTHAYAVNSKSYDKVIGYLEAMLRYVCTTDEEKIMAPVDCYYYVAMSKLNGDSDESKDFAIVNGYKEAHEPLNIYQVNPLIADQLLTESSDITGGTSNNRMAFPIKK